MTKNSLSKVLCHPLDSLHFLRTLPVGSCLPVPSARDEAGLVMKLCFPLEQVHAGCWMKLKVSRSKARMHDFVKYLFLNSSKLQNVLMWSRLF